MAPPSPSQDAITAAILAVDQVVCRIVRTKLRATLSANDGREQNLDALEVLGDIRVKLLRKVSEEPDSIASLNSYAATSAYNACSDYLRAKYPGRTRVKNAVRRTLEKTNGLAAWQATTGTATGDWMAGYAGWKMHSPYASPWVEVIAIPPDGVDTSTIGGVAKLCRHVFENVNAPVTLDDLVAWIQRCIGGRELGKRVADEPAGENEPPGGILEKTAAKTQTSEAHWLAVERMRLLWDAIRQLLPWHRAAYLLNLREGELDAFPYYGVASIDDIRAVLDLQPEQSLRMANAFGVDPKLEPAEQFAACWRHLPAEDQILAVVLGVERSQVIAYRNKGIERLRRMLSSLR